MKTSVHFASPLLSLAASAGVLALMALGACPASNTDGEPEPEAEPEPEPEPEAPASCTEPTDVACADELTAALSLQAGNLNPGEVSDVFEGDAVVTTVNAKSGGIAADPRQSFIYARFTDNGLQKLSVADEGALGSMSWDIAFHRYIVRLNGGSNGPSCVSSAKVDGAFETVNENTSASFRLDGQFDDACAFRADSEAGDPANEKDFGNGLRDYYTYGGCLAMSDQVFLIRLASGRVVKWQMQRYYNEESQAECNTGEGTSGVGAGELVMKWAFLDGFVGGDGDGDGDGDVWTYEGDPVVNGEEANDVTWTRVHAPSFTTPVYFDFETKSQVFPVAPDDTDQYDLAFRNFRAHTNGGASGTGNVAVAVIENGDFAALETAPDGPYYQDLDDLNLDNLNDDVFSDQYPWYIYDDSTHILTPNDNVYVVRSHEGAYYKLKMVSYYFEEIEERNHFMTFRWAEVVAPGSAGGDAGVSDQDAGGPVPSDGGTSDAGPGDGGMP